MPSLLLFLRDLERTQVLLDFSFVDSVFIFEVLQCHLPGFLQLCLLIDILEEQMFQSLFPDLYCDLIFFFKILELSLLVPVLCLFVFKLLFSDKPKVIYSQTFIIVKTSEVLLSFDRLFECTTL